MRAILYIQGPGIEHYEVKSVLLGFICTYSIHLPRSLPYLYCFYG